MTERATPGRSTARATGQPPAAKAAAKPKARTRKTKAKPRARKEAASAAPPATGDSRPTGNRRAKPGARAKAKDDGVNLHELGARVVSVYGPFGSRTLVEMPTPAADALFPDGLNASARTDVIDAALRDVAAIRELDEDLGDSALAAAAVALAYEIAHPGNSATSKSMCAREMREHLDRLRELLPDEDEDDEVDEIAAKRAARQAAAAKGAG